MYIHSDVAYIAPCMHKASYVQCLATQYDYILIYKDNHKFVIISDFKFLKKFRSKLQINFRTGQQHHF